MWRGDSTIPTWGTCQFVELGLWVYYVRYNHDFPVTFNDLQCWPICMYFWCISSANDYEILDMERSFGYQAYTATGHPRPTQCYFLILFFFDFMLSPIWSLRFTTLQYRSFSPSSSSAHQKHYHFAWRPNGGTDHLPHLHKDVVRPILALIERP